MLIYAPSDGEEFAPVVGGLTEDEFRLIEDCLITQAPGVRYLKVADGGTHPSVQRFTLLLHREDRERALPAVDEAVNRIRPYVSRIEWMDRTLAVLVRQAARAREAGDQAAVDLMVSYLFREAQWLLEVLLNRAKTEGAVDLWLDGISAEDVAFVSPFGLEARGHIHVGRSSDGSQWHEPFEAELQASVGAPALERFVVRFGERGRLVSEAVVRADLEEEHPLGGRAFAVRAGSRAPRCAEQALDWAFVFTKE
jgi:hypothetical protein